MGNVTACGACGCTDLPVILDLGFQPIAERFDDPERYPLALARCEGCTLAQLTYAVDQDQLFPPDHPYTSGTSRALREHFGELRKRIEEAASPGELVIDIGANDGTLLSQVRSDIRRIAIEPTHQARKCASQGIRTHESFFTSALARVIARLDGKAKVITACNVLAHVPDVHDFLDGVNVLLDADGVFITENHDLRSITEGLQIDTIYHEHLRYFSLTSLAHLLALHGLEIQGANAVGTHGGSLRVYARKPARHLDERAHFTAWKLGDLVAGLAPVYGVGACTRAVPLIHFADLARYITCICEVPGSEKIGKLMPGTGIPVVDEARLIEDQPDYALLFAWHLRSSIVPALRRAGYEGKFIVPLPEPEIISD